MTVKRDFKRRVRQRQARTGESYVTARRRLLASRPGGAAGDGDGDDTDPGKAAAVADDAFEVRDLVRVIDGPFAGFAGVIEGLVEPDRLAVVLTMRGRSVAVELATGQVEPVPAEAGPTTAPISVVEMLDVSDEARRCGLVCRVVMFPSLAARVAPARLLVRLRELLVATHGDPAIERLSSLALTGEAVGAGRRLGHDEQLDAGAQRLQPILECTDRRAGRSARASSAARATSRPASAPECA